MVVVGAVEEVDTEIAKFVLEVLFIPQLSIFMRNSVTLISTEFWPKKIYCYWIHSLLFSERSLQVWFYLFE